LPNTGIEASACSTPVVGFNTGGISDIIKHRETGYLAKAFDTVDLANGIYWTLADSKRNIKLGNNARDRAVSKWSNHIVAQQYSAIYQQTLDV
jgi:glycosyltransferase involved in cell wall biosynthesis